MRRRPLVRNALLLMGAAAISRAIGTGYRILIVRLAGAEALGLFQMVLPVFRTASTLSTLRLPVGLTRLTAHRLARGDVEGVYEARSQTAILITVLSLLTTLLTWTSAPFIARHLVTDPRVERLIWLLPLAFVPSAFTGIFRGFAEGRQSMLGNAVGQVTEQLVRVAVVFLLLTAWRAQDTELAAVALVLGLGAGELAGLITVACLSGWNSLPKAPPRTLRERADLRGFLRRRRRIQGQGGLVQGLLQGWRAAVRPLDTTRELLQVSVPLWVATMINTTVQMVNVTLIPRRLLAAGFSIRQATELYGQLTGMVLPLLYLPMILIFPVSTVLTPAVADRVAAGHHRDARAQFFKATAGALAVGLLSSAGFLLFPRQLSALLYDAPEIAPLVQLVALAPPFAYTASIFASVLHALGKTQWLLFSFILTSVIRLALVYWLTADPDLGVAGGLWGIIVDYVLTAFINGWAAWRFLHRPPSS